MTNENICKRAKILIKELWLLRRDKKANPLDILEREKELENLKKDVGNI